MRAVALVVILWLAGCTSYCDLGPRESHAVSPGLYEALVTGTAGYHVDAVDAVGFPLRNVSVPAAVASIEWLVQGDSVEGRSVYGGGLLMLLEWPGTLTIERDPVTPWSRVETDARAFLDDVTAASDAQVSAWLAAMEPSPREQTHNGRLVHEGPVANVEVAHLGQELEPAPEAVRSAGTETVGSFWGDAGPYRVRGSLPVRSVNWAAEGQFTLQVDVRDLVSVRWSGYPRGLHDDVGEDGMLAMAADELDAMQAALGLPELAPELYDVRFPGHC